MLYTYTFFFSFMSREGIHPDKMTCQGWPYLYCSRYLVYLITALDMGLFIC